nr:MaoC/PaaZ C-terminal domain-containing protein [Actinomyces bowdenii]
MAGAGGAEDVQRGLGRASSIEQVSPDHPDDARAQALAAALLPILHRAREAACAGPSPADGGAPWPVGAIHDAVQQPQGLAAAARRGAQGILPAVIALEELHGAITPWDGLLHRRCAQRLLAAAREEHSPPGAGGAARGSEGAGAPHRAGAPEVSVVRRSGWELIRTRSTVHVLGGTWLVRHELARRLDAVEHAAVAATAAPGGPRREGARRTALQLTLSRQDLRAWAHSSGDGNALHLRSGAAAQAGLAVGSSAVIAHGLLIGALSLALVPRGGAAAPDDVLRFPAPVEVPRTGTAPLRLDPDGSCMNDENKLVLLRD